ncbi:ANT(3'') family aminoglycoside nucleotidyltransferase, partial [Acinetobacter baumannii]
QNDVTLKMPAFEWVHVQLHQQKGMISLSPPTICNSAEVTIVVHDDIIPWRYPAKRELQFGEWQRNDILAGIFE